MPIDRHEIERIRRSIAMLSPRAPALNREQAMLVLAELQRLDRALRELRDALNHVLDDG